MNKLYFAESDKKMLSRLDGELKNIFKSSDKVAIKLHMGEVYNPNHLQPDFVKKVVTLMKELGLKPFLFDSPTMYEGPRHTVEGYLRQAAKLGFTEESVGCPVVISDDYVEVKGKRLTYQVCKPLADADGVLVLSHFKGHACCGVGGAVKNLGMGALTSKSKNDIHQNAMPELKGKCSLCKKCLEVCPQKCITYNEENGRGAAEAPASGLAGSRASGRGGRLVGPVFNRGKCYGCSKCIQHCPNKCLKPRVAEFDELLADGAAAALRKFKKAYFVNVLRRIANVCDCSSRGLHIVCPDIGILMGRDACAIDRASVDLVNRKTGKGLFLELWHKQPLMHVGAAERLGVGSQDYALEDA
ncbi:MAG: DUF362 domain-containing protein [Candidatus Aenigmarchaeota archaeon]|nr:DUF362 domain-containing protein [Candidatus Aenigmarchaeota archaeon]